MTDIYCDCADLEQIREMKKNPLVCGFTTNPTLIRNAGVTDYEAFCKEALQIVEGLPISFEVFSDEWDEMEKQARKIASWGKNVNVKIPITNTKGESAAPLVAKLSVNNITCNVTAILTKQQALSLAEQTIPYIEGRGNPNIIISIFCGRISDAGYDPEESVYYTKGIFSKNDKAKILWASTREVLNIYQAEKCGCHIITVTPDLLKRYEALKGKDLTEYSRDTVRMFYNDAKKAGYTL